MTTKFEQARGRPKPPPVTTFEHPKYQRKHKTWAIWRKLSGAWLAIEPTGRHYTEHPTWERAIQWVGEQVKRGR